MMVFSLLIVILVVILLPKLVKFMVRDPFRYIWDLDLLDRTYNELKESQNYQFDILNFYQMAKWRIKRGLSKGFPNNFFADCDNAMNARRSLDGLLDRAMEYAGYLAKWYGYDEAEIANPGFYCPGWNELWNLFYKHRERILSKSRARHTTGDQESAYEYFYGRSKTDNRSKTQSKNEQIFQGITDIKELKKKYFRLAKINHPDHGGSEQAMKLLNQYYQEALDRLSVKQ